MSPAAPSPSWLAQQGRLPLAFMALGLSWLAVSVTVTAIAPGLLTLPHLVPTVVGLTHAWILGFFVTVALGAMYQLAPVALSTTLWSERSGWWHFGLHTVAVPFMIAGFWRWNLSLLGVAGLVLAAGVWVFAINLTVTIVRSGKRDAVAWSLLLATAWLVVTVTAGLTLVANRLWAFWLTDPVALLRAHAHLGLVGFFLTLLQGVTFRLVPMFTLGEVPDWRPVRTGLWLSQLGLVVLAPALAWHQGVLAAAAALLIVAGMACSAWALVKTLRTRRKRQLEPGIQALVRGMVALVVAAVGGAWMALPATRAGSAPGGMSANVYGVLLVAAGLLPAIAGMMNKIVPFLTWMRAYGPAVGRRPTPAASTLGHAALETWGLGLQSAALVPLLVGVWMETVSIVAVGAVVLAAGTALFLANMARVLRHLWRPDVLPIPQRAPA